LLTRQRRRQEKAAALLRPLLLEALGPVAQAMERLGSRQQELAGLVVQIPAELQGNHLATQELLLEILQALTPPAHREIARQIGLPPQPTSSPSSAS
jgi:hypothetical protein